MRLGQCNSACGLDLSWRGTVGCLGVEWGDLWQVLPAIADMLAAESQLIVLVKPQFEAGKSQACSMLHLSNRNLLTMSLVLVLDPANGISRFPASVVHTSLILQTRR